MFQHYQQRQPILTNMVYNNFVGQWSPANQEPTEPTQAFQGQDSNADHGIHRGSFEESGQDIDSILEERRRLSSMSSMPCQGATPFSMLTPAYAAPECVQEQAIDYNSHYGSISSTASSNNHYGSISSTASGSFGNLEHSNRMTELYGEGSGGGGDLFARFFPNGETVWQQNTQRQYEQPPEGQHTPVTQQTGLPPARADNRVPISRRHDSAISNTGSTQSRNNSHVSPTGLDGQQSLPRSTQPTQPAAMGPMSVGVIVPPRPKPGRKPIEPAHAQDRRRVQNRMAQRNFRDKRQLKLVEAKEENEKMKAERDAERAEMARDRETFRQQLKQISDQAEAERQQSTARIAALEQQLNALQQSYQLPKQNSEAHHTSHNIGGFRPASNSHSYTQSSVPTPPEDNYYETDYTNFGRTEHSGYNLRNATSNENDPMDTTMDDDPCGFCSDESNCVCLQAKLAKRKEVVAAPPAAITLPGNCEACRLDPARAKACRDMANSTRMVSRAPLPQAPRPNLTSSMPAPDYSCSAMVDKFNQFGERHATIGNLFGRGQLTAYPRQNGGYEFEEKEAAEVLSTLSRRSTMAESPREDPDSQRP